MSLISGRKPHSISSEREDASNVRRHAIKSFCYSYGHRPSTFNHRLVKGERIENGVNGHNAVCIVLPCNLELSSYVVSSRDNTCNYVGICRNGSLRSHLRL